MEDGANFLWPSQIIWTLRKWTDVSLDNSIQFCFDFSMNTVFPHIVAAATILFWIHQVRKLFKERKLIKGGNYMRKYGNWFENIYILFHVCNDYRYIPVYASSNRLYFCSFNGYILPYARHYNPLLIRNHSWILTIHKAKGHSISMSIRLI